MTSHSAYYLKHIFMCTQQKEPGKTCCANTGGSSYAEDLKTKLNALQRHGKGKVRVSRSGCLGRCNLGPCLVIYPEGIWYTYHSYEDIDEIINRSILQGEIVSRLQISDVS